MQDMDEDRRNVRVIQLNEQRLDERIKQLEYISGISETKPKVFQDLDNTILNMRIKMTEEIGEAVSNLKLSIARNHIVEGKMGDCEKTVRSLEKLIHLRDEQLMELTDRCS